MLLFGVDTVGPVSAFALQGGVQRLSADAELPRDGGLRHALGDEFARREDLRLREV